MRYIQLAITSVPIAASTSLGFSTTSWAQQDVFTLGTIAVHGDKNNGIGAGSVLSNEEMWRFDKKTLDDAVNIIPGVTAANTGGSRNERLIYVRGFDRFQVPLSIDGIRIYLPADNRLDFGRFLTPDLSEIQVSKGYVSVLDGPGGMGGAINLVTRKPTKPFEAELRTGLSLGPQGGYNSWNGYAMAGTRQERYYAQLSGAVVDQDHWTLSDGFRPTANENGGARGNSNSRDWRLNAKIGFTPNETDEYTLSFTRQSGRKEAPLHVSDPVAQQRYWRWPYWDIQNIYWLSNTRIGDASYVKTRLYYNTFKNGLFSYDDPAMTRQTLARSFRSYYDDYAYGGSIEAGTDLIPMNTLKVALHYRRDNHREYQRLYSPTPFREPWQTTTEDTYSVALEDTFHVTDELDLVAGFGYDWRRLSKAQDFTGSGATGQFINYQRRNNDAFNWQAAAIYRFNNTARVYASVSSRTRFPTIFERFSTRFGGATSNPDLKAERAINYEVGGGVDIAPRTRLTGALFYSDVKDMIQSVPLVVNGTAVTQSRNVGDGEYYGFEVSLTSDITPIWRVGGNYTLLKRDITAPADPLLKPIGTPLHQLFLYTTWQPIEGLSITPNIQIASNRWTVNTAGTRYYKTGAYAVVNLQAEYAINANVRAAIGIRNFFDQNYTLVDGFPEPGRSIYGSLRVTF